MWQWRFGLIAGAVSLVAISLSALGQGKGVITQKTLSLDLAQAISQGSLERCRADGYQVSVVVLDGNGLLKMAMTDDQAGPQTMELSRRKAYTAVVFKRPSSEQAKIWAAMAPLMPDVEGTLARPGGLPIKVDKETIGAVGVAGAPGDKNEVCAAAGISRVADKLK